MLQVFFLFSDFYAVFTLEIELREHMQSNSKIVLISGSVRDVIRDGKSTGDAYHRLTKNMGYHDTNILWGSLMLVKPHKLAHGGQEYSMSLPRLLLIDENFPATPRNGAHLPKGQYMGRIALQFNNDKWWPGIPKGGPVLACSDSYPGPDGEVEFFIDELRLVL